MTKYTKGQMTMALASQLNLEGGVDAGLALNIAMDTMEAGSVPPKWRSKLGVEVADAIDADLADPKTWRKR